MLKKMGTNIKKIKKGVLFIKINSYFYVKILFVNKISNNNYIYLFTLLMIVH